MSKEIKIKIKINKIFKRNYRLKIMRASVASDSGIGPDKLLLFNLLEERDKGADNIKIVCWNQSSDVEIYVRN